MPGLDSTGPEGQGPRTGRQMGKCKPRKGSIDPENKKTTPEDNVNPEEESFRGRGLGKGLGFGRGNGPGRGRGRGFGRGRGRF
jgi:hypothetical protein